MSTEPGYDDLNRLLTATGSAYGSQSFTYDAIGNMTNKHGQTMTYGAGSAGPHAVTEVTSTQRPTWCPPSPAACTMDYDANGNMTVRGQDTLTYDSENRIKDLRHYEGIDGSTNYTFKPGWNVVSFTHLPDNQNVANVLSPLTFGTDYDQVSTWDSTSGTWKHWVNDSDFNDFTSFEYGKTYEIYNKAGVDKSLTVTGKTLAVDITHSIKAGDNFISPAVKTATNVTTVLSGLTLNTHYSDVKRFNATTQAWESYAGGAFTQFEPGKGYNIIGLTTASFSYGKTETISTFVYDSTGARVKKTAGSTTTVYLGKDYEIEGAVTTKHIFLGDRRITTKKSTGEIQYIHEDHINSSNVITDASGNRSALLEYTPFGSTATYSGSANPKHKFTGQEEDAASGLYYYGARYYDPQIGRFVTADPTIQHPTDPQDFNRYAYARNNPILFNDPTGLGWLSKLFAFVFAIATLPFTAGQSAWIIIGAATLGGAFGGLTGAAIEKSNLLRGALQGAAIGAAVGTGASLAQGAPAGIGGGPSSSPQIEILVPTKAGEVILETVPAAAEVTAESGGSAVFSNIMGATTAVAASEAANRVPKGQSKNKSDETIRLFVYSRPTEFANGAYDHLFAIDGKGNSIELDRINGKNKIFNDSDRTNSNKKYSDKLKGGLDITLDKRKFDEAFARLKVRYDGKAYNPWNNSNNFIINLLKEAGRPLREEELSDLGITNVGAGILGLITFPRLFRFEKNDSFSPRDFYQFRAMPGLTTFIPSKERGLILKNKGIK